jgi:hypothetical protein
LAAFGVQVGVGIVFNSASLWHSGTLNYSPGLRLAVTTYLSAPAARAGP